MVIGVYDKNDQRIPVGIERDDFKNKEHYENTLTQSIQDKIKDGTKYLGDYIQIRITKIRGDLFCIVD